MRTRAQIEADLADALEVKANLDWEDENDPAGAPDWERDDATDKLHALRMELGDFEMGQLGIEPYASRMA